MSRWVADSRRPTAGSQNLVPYHSLRAIRFRQGRKHGQAEVNCVEKGLLGEKVCDDVLLLFTTTHVYTVGCVPWAPCAIKHMLPWYAGR